MYIPGYGNVLEADFTKPPDPNKIAPGVSQLLRPAPVTGRGAVNAPLGGRPGNWQNPANTPPAGGTSTTIPSLPDFIPGGAEEARSTDPATPPQPDPYPTVLPSLSAEQLGQLAERRRLLDERLQQAEAESERRRLLVEASANRSRESAERESRRDITDFMRQAGGRGLARSPMVAGRRVRRAGEDLRLQYGEIDTQLSTEIAALQDLVSRAENERSTGLAQIEQERVNMQADLNRLFPAGSMYRS